MALLIKAKNLASVPFSECWLSKLFACVIDSLTPARSSPCPRPWSQSLDETSDGATELTDSRLTHVFVETEWLNWTLSCFRQGFAPR